MVIQSISRNLLLFLPGLIYTGALDHQNYGLINGEKCGLSTKDENSDDGPVLVGEFPWMVLISVKKNSDASSESSHCAGTILNENYVLTAAHCLTDKKNTHVSSAKVYLPVCTSSEEGIAHNSETIIVHPDYRDEYKHGYDIGLIRVKEAFDFNELVAPICLVHGDLLKQHYDGEKGQVAGFEAYKFAGTEYDKPICPNEIQKFTVPILNEQVCRTRVQQSTPPHSWSSPTVLNSQICAGSVTDEVPYVGDSGSPLTLLKQVDSDTPRHYQIGLVSFGGYAKETPKSKSPTVYTRLSKYVEWILDNLEP